jgi:hypothetical protein
MPADVIVHVIHYRAYAGLVRGVCGAETRHSRAQNRNIWH